MNREEIRAEAVERAAAALHAALTQRAIEETGVSNLGSWFDPPPFVRRVITANAVAIVEALGDMLPVDIERGYHCGDADSNCCDEEPGPCSWTSDEQVERKIRSSGQKWQRYVTAWQEVTDA